MIREQMPTQCSLGIEPMCRLATVSRAGYYRFLRPRYPGEEQMEVRNAIQQIVLEHRRRYGYRRVTVELGRRGMAVNHKRVLRLMREDNLLGIEPRAFVATAASDHDQAVYLNLARRMKLTAINQLWVADITYIRLRQEFVYLAVVLDGFSRKVIGWALDRTLTTRLPLLALQRAIASFFFSGFPALLYQIVWQRALFTIYGVNIQSVTVIVTVFMLGLGLRKPRRGRLSTVPDIRDIELWIHRVVHWSLRCMLSVSLQIRCPIHCGVPPRQQESSRFSCC